jgi:hypothetical protein
MLIEANGGLLRVVFLMIGGVCATILAQRGVDAFGWSKTKVVDYMRRRKLKSSPSKSGDDEDPERGCPLLPVNGHSHTHVSPRSLGELTISLKISEENVGAIINGVIQFFQKNPQHLRQHIQINAEAEIRDDN